MFAEKTCPACRFWLWFEDRSEYRCSIKGCFEYSKFIEYGYLSKEEQNALSDTLKKKSKQTGIKIT